MPRRDRDGEERVDWVREVHRTARASGRVHDLPDVAETPVRAPTASSAAAATPQAAQPQAATGPAALTGLIAGVVSLSDNAQTAVYAAALKADGVTGAYVGGYFGEGQLFGIEERKTAVSQWARSGLPLIVDASAQSPWDTEQLVQHAKASGEAVKAIAVALPQVYEPRTVEDAVLLLCEASRVCGNFPLLYVHRRTSPFRAHDVLRAAAPRAAALRGAIFASADMADLSACLALREAQSNLSTIIHADESTMSAASLFGAKAFCSVHFSTVAPLFSKVIAAAAKADGSLAKFQALLNKYFNLVHDVAGLTPEREVAAAKAIVSFRLEIDPAHMRVPGPRLTVVELERLRQGMEAFVKAYAAAVGASAAPAPSAETTKINVHAMPGFNGKLDEKIKSRAIACGRAAGVADILDYFPHLGRQWRGRLPDKNCDVAKYIDHTVLKPECLEEEITKLTQEAKKHRFYAVCVNGCRVQQCIAELRGSGVQVAAVIGFPLGAMTSKAKAREAREIVSFGATEIDMVMNVGAMRDGNLRLVYEDIKAVVDASKPAIVKVIFETCLLTPDQIMDASILSVAAGAGFLKTATGFNKGGATPEAIDIMLAVAGNECQVKASGAVRNAPDALAYITAGVTRIGTSSGIAIVTGAQSSGGY